MPPAPDLLQQLTPLAFGFALLTCRCGAAMTMLPGLSEDGPPAILRAGMALFLAVLLLPIVGPELPAVPPDFAHLAALAGNELAAGAFLGWLARLIMLALPAAAQIMSLTNGLSSVLQPDSNFGAQTASLGRLFGIAAPVLLLSTGLYELPLRALAGSYAAWPAGHAPDLGDIVDTAVRAVSQHFALAVRLAAPFLLAGTVWQLGLGLISRLVPQLQIYFAALPGQILGGLVLLSMLAEGMTEAWLHAADSGFRALPGH